jgi:hypothetical protein
MVVFQGTKYVCTSDHVAAFNWRPNVTANLWRLRRSRINRLVLARDENGRARHHDAPVLFAPLAAAVSERGRQARDVACA